MADMKEIIILTIGFIHCSAYINPMSLGIL